MLRIVSIACFATLAASAASNGWLIVANKGDETVGIIDPGAGREVVRMSQP
jgi:hypothetical protein